MASMFKGIVPIQFATTRLPEDGQSSGSDFIAMRYSHTETGPSFVIAASPEKPVLLKSITHAVIQGFNGGSATIDVGDGSTSNKYLANSAITEATAGNTVTGTVGAWLEAAGTIKVTIGGSAGTEGIGLVVAEVLRFDADILD